MQGSATTWGLRPLKLLLNQNNRNSLWQHLHKDQPFLVYFFVNQGSGKINSNFWNKITSSSSSCNFSFIFFRLSLLILNCSVSSFSYNAHNGDVNGQTTLSSVFFIYQTEIEWLNLSLFQGNQCFQILHEGAFRNQSNI